MDDHPQSVYRNQDRSHPFSSCHCGFAQKSKSHLGVVSQFKNYSFLPVMVSEARTILRSGSARASRIHPDNLSLTMPRQGVLPRMRHLLPQKAFNGKMHGRKLPETAWRSRDSSDPSTCAPAAAPQSRGAQDDKQETFRSKLRHYPGNNTDDTDLQIKNGPMNFFDLRISVLSLDRW